MNQNEQTNERTANDEFRANWNALLVSRKMKEKHTHTWSRCFEISGVVKLAKIRFSLIFMGCSFFFVGKNVSDMGTCVHIQKKLFDS